MSETTSKAPSFLRRAATPAAQTTPTLTQLQESKVIKDFFMEIARAGDKLNQQDTELEELRKQNGEIGNKMILLEKEVAFQHSASERILADMRRALNEMRLQRDGALSAFHELRAHISVIQTNCAAVVEAGNAAQRAATDTVRRLSMDQKAEPIDADELAIKLEAELIGKKFSPRKTADEEAVK